MSDPLQRMQKRSVGRGWFHKDGQSYSFFFYMGSVQQCNILIRHSSTLVSLGCGVWVYYGIFKFLECAHFHNPFITKMCSLEIVNPKTLKGAENIQDWLGMVAWNILVNKSSLCLYSWSKIRSWWYLIYMLL